jgi:acyl-coenzyme A synthetase/AMP-(fatty) acid ligase
LPPVATIHQRGRVYHDRKALRYDDGVSVSPGIKSMSWPVKSHSAGLLDGCRQNIAACKVPKSVEFVDALPKPGSGKIMWRQLQERGMAC